jgi:hypothetical protein
MYTEQFSASFNIKKNPEFCFDVIKEILTQIDDGDKREFHGRHPETLWELRDFFN